MIVTSGGVNSVSVTIIVSICAASSWVRSLSFTTTFTLLDGHYAVLVPRCFNEPFEQGSVSMAAARATLAAAATASSVVAAANLIEA